MNEEIANIKLIDQYLEGELNDVQQKEVEARLKEDADFAALMEDVQAMRIAAELSGRASMKERLREVEREAAGSGQQAASGQRAASSGQQSASGKKGTKRFSIGRVLSMAAAVALLVGVSVWLLRPEPTQGELYYAMHKKSIVISDKLATRGIGGEQLLKDGMNAYKAGNYRKSANTLQKYFESNEINEHAVYYAISLMKGNKFEEAEKVLINYLKVGGILTEDAEYILGMLYVHNDDIESLRALIDKNKINKKLNKILEDYE